MLYIRRAEDRFLTDEEWRESRHTFSFGAHRDPRFDGFRRLRAINDDRIEAGAVSPELTHDAEIVSFVVEGALVDSLCGGAVVEPGDVEHIYGAVVHRERAGDGATRVIEIWLEPDERRDAASYEVVHVARAANELRLIASGAHGVEDEGVVALHEDAAIFAARLTREAHVEHPLRAKRFAWIQVLRGSVHMNGIPLSNGDGAAVAEVPSIALRSSDDDAEVLLIDLA